MLLYVLRGAWIEEVRRGNLSDRLLAGVFIKETVVRFAIGDCRLVHDVFRVEILPFEREETRLARCDEDVGVLLQVAAQAQLCEWLLARPTLPWQA